ncbi:hypothetical protein JCM11641_001224 [Rhodosporidiobolus odoratus]
MAHWLNGRPVYHHNSTHATERNGRTDWNPPPPLFREEDRRIGHRDNRGATDYASHPETYDPSQPSYSSQLSPSDNDGGAYNPAFYPHLANPPQPVPPYHPLPLIHQPYQPHPHFHNHALQPFYPPPPPLYPTWQAPPPPPTGMAPFQPSWPAYQHQGGRSLPEHSMWHDDRRERRVDEGNWRDRQDRGRDAWSTGEYRPRRASYERQDFGQRNDWRGQGGGYQPDQPRERFPERRRWDNAPSPSRSNYPPRDRGHYAQGQGHGQGYDLDHPDQGYLSSARYDDQGTYIAPTRRQKKHQRSTVVGEPTADYLAIAREEENRIVTIDQLEEGGEGIEVPEPPILVMDLNHTLLCRAKRTSWGSRQPLVRPYLAPFLEYICSSSSTSTTASPSDHEPSTPTAVRRPRFLPIIYSSARSPNVLTMLSALSLLAPSRPLPSTHSSSSSFKPFSAPPYAPDPSQGDVLNMVFTREMMGLNAQDFDGDVETTKDLGRVWEEMGLGGLKGWVAEVRREKEGMVQREMEWEGEGRELGRRERNPDEISIDESEGEGDGCVAEGEGQNGGIGGKGEPPKLNAKGKPGKRRTARFAKERDEIGARRTILLDDEASKAAQQPHTHLPIRPFIVPAPSFPPPLPSPSSSPSNPGFTPPPIGALELPPFSTLEAAQDLHLLSTIYLLERLRCSFNISSAIRSGFVEKIRDECKGELVEEGKERSEKEVDERLAERGRGVCERYGVEVRREWDGGWRERLLRREGRWTEESAIGGE